MSRSPTATIQCAKCFRQSQVEVIGRINADRSPDQRRALLAGELLLFKCPHCRQQVRMDQPLLYHDMRRQFMIWWVSDAQEQAGFQIDPNPRTPLAGVPPDDRCHRADQNRPVVGTSKPASLRREIYNSFLFGFKECLAAS